MTFRTIQKSGLLSFISKLIQAIGQFRLFLGYSEVAK